MLDNFVKRFYFRVGKRNVFLGYKVLYVLIIREIYCNDDSNATALLIPLSEKPFRGLLQYDYDNDLNYSNKNKENNK